MEFLRFWWRRPFDYTWAVNHHRAGGSLTAVRVCIGVWSCVYGVAVVLCVGASGGPRGSVLAYAVAVVAAVTSVLVGVAWIRGPWPSERVALSFVVYSDVAVVAFLFTFEDPFVAMPGCALFAVTGAQVTAFHSPRWLLAHLVFATAVTVGIYVSVVFTSETDVRMATARLVVLLPVLLSAPILVQAGLMDLRSDAIDAFRDHLTGLRNRRGLEADYFDVYESVPGSVVCALLVDIDEFKLINDKHGHQAGDRVLQRLAARLIATTGPEALVARVGGEEFAVAMTGSADEMAFLTGRVVESVHDTGDRYPITVSVGAAMTAPLTPTSIGDRTTVPALQQLLRVADTAMYVSKKRGGNGCTIAFDSEY